MRRVARGLLLAASLVLPARAAETLVIGYFDLPPHGSERDGKPAGWALDYLSRIAREMGVTPSWRPQPLARLLVDRQLDMVLYLVRTPERQRTLQFASQPLWWAQGVLVVAADSPVQAIRSSADLTGLRIGSVGGGYVSPLMAGVLREEIGTRDFIGRSLRKVALGRIDAFYNPDDVAIRYALRADSMSSLRLLTLPEAATGMYPAFTDRGRRWLPAFERARQRVAARQSYAALVQQRMAAVRYGSPALQAWQP